MERERKKVKEGKKWVRVGERTKEREVEGSERERGREGGKRKR